MSENKNYEIINGEECQANIDKYFDRQGIRYARVKDGFAIRVYKATVPYLFYSRDQSQSLHESERSLKKCITFMLLLPGTKVHLGELYWNYEYLHLKTTESYQSYQSYHLHVKKCRADAAFIESSKQLNSEKEIKSPYSYFTSSFQYPKGTTIFPHKFNTDENTEFSTCAPGIHFFFSRADVIVYNFD